ncbi:MAG: cytochrome c [Flavobacteriales bacterium]|nr:cytochrome c [Flavobacteriales bacterium]
MVLDVKQFVIGLSTLLFIGCGTGELTVIEDNGPTTVTEVDAKKLYNRHCVDCHGMKGDLGLMGAESLVSSSMSFDNRISIITDGSKNGKMKPFGIAHYGDLNPVEVEAVATYIESLRQ